MWHGPETWLAYPGSMPWVIIKKGRRLSSKLELDARDRMLAYGSKCSGSKALCISPMLAFEIVCFGGVPSTNAFPCDGSPVVHAFHV